MEIEINPELQGADLRHSCLADQLELQAVVNGSSFSEKELADRIENSGWLRILSPRLSNDPALEIHQTSLGDRQDRCLEIAKQIFQLINQRQEILGDAYPFEQRRYSRIHLKDERVDGAYLWLLVLSVAHGYSIPLESPPDKSFELSVTEALAATGMQAVNIGTAAGRNFETTLKEIGDSYTCLTATPENAVHPVSANDGGGDTIAMLPFVNDSRHGHWIFVGQSTVGKCDDWLKKISEVMPPMWKDCFAGRVVAIPFFATPYHISDHHLEYLVTNHGRSIWDRLRIAQFISPDSDKTAQAVSRLKELRIV